jgi:hypothetical protein
MQTEGFIPDGSRRLQETTALQVEVEVRSAFAPEMAAAGFFERLMLRLVMRGEIRRRVKALVPNSPHINWTKR